MSAPILDPELGVWFCPDDGRILRLAWDGATLTQQCPECLTVWDATATVQVSA